MHTLCISDNVFASSCPLCPHLSLSHCLVLQQQQFRFIDRLSRCLSLVFSLVLVLHNTKTQFPTTTTTTMSLKRPTESLEYVCPDRIDTDTLSIENVTERAAAPDPTSECPICMTELVDISDTNPVVKLSGCGHYYHLDCIRQAIGTSPTCPICRLPVGEPRGKCPSGTMVISGSSQSCGGFQQCGTIQIRYQLRSGQQKTFHPNPGVRYSGTSRTAYLPDCTEGQDLLKRLKYAWRRGLSFTVGTSLTTGASNVIVWSSIHHKTSMHGGVHGYPDPGYFANCNEELDNLSVPNADALTEDGLIANGKRSRDFSDSDSDCSLFQNVVTSLSAPPPPMNPSAMMPTPFAPFAAAASMPFFNNTATTTALQPSAPTLYAPPPPPQQQVIGALQVVNETVHYKAPTTLPLQTPTMRYGTSLSGSMTIGTANTICDGYQSTTSNSIRIKYELPSAMQESYHPNPGGLCAGTTREAYLPNNQDGHDLLERLKCAFQRGLTFEVGTFPFPGLNNVVKWSSLVPHKTMTTGGPGSFGFPDPSYFTHCHQLLDSLAVPTTAQLHAMNGTISTSHPLPQSPPLLPQFPYIIQYVAPPSNLPLGYGTGPSGTMTIDSISQTCGGFATTTTASFEITYTMPSGTQAPYHPSPGSRFRGDTRTAYLPDNADGRLLLKRLGQAWTCGLCFSIGTSQASGRSNTVVWSTIPHKSRLVGGAFGFPDASYFVVCHGELDRLGVADGNSLVW